MSNIRSQIFKSVSEDFFIYASNVHKCLNDLNEYVLTDCKTHLAIRTVLMYCIR